jgi:Holliday junction resolvase-like predicted endonuclease
MKITKSTRHSKIAGNFGETIVLYWLSKYGFECALVDHTGIDIIARNPHTKEVMGISVKSRTRSKGGEGESVTIPNKNLNKANAACKAFGCTPYFAIVVDAGDTIRVYISSMKHLLKIHPQGKRSSEWKMSRAYINKYSKDKQIERFAFKTETTNWRSSK